MLNVKNYRRKSSMLNRYISDLPSSNYSNQRNDRETQKQKNGVPDLRIQDFVTPQKPKGRKVDQATPQPPKRQFRVRLFYNNKADKGKEIVVQEPQKKKIYEKPPIPAEKIVPEVTPILDGIIDDIIGNMHRSKKFYFSKTLKTTVKNRPRAYQEQNTARENVIEHRWSSKANHPSKGFSAPRKREDQTKNSSSSNSSNNSDFLRVEHVSVEIGATYGTSSVKTTSEVHFPNSKGQKKKRRDKKRPSVCSVDKVDANRDDGQNKIFEKVVNLKDSKNQAQPPPCDEQKDELFESFYTALPSQEKKHKNDPPVKTEQKKMPMEKKKKQTSTSEKKQAKQRREQPSTQRPEFAASDIPSPEKIEKNRSPMPTSRKTICESLPQSIRDIIGQELLEAMREKIGSDQLSSDTRELIGQQLLSALREPVKEEPALQMNEEFRYPNLESMGYGVPQAFQDQKDQKCDRASKSSATRQPIGHHLPQRTRESIGRELLDALRKFIAQNQLPPDARENVGQEILQAMREPVEPWVSDGIVRKPIGHMLPQSMRDYIGKHLFNAMMELVCIKILSEDVREIIGQELQAEMCKSIDKTKDLLSARNVIGKILSSEQRRLVTSELFDLMKWYICEDQLPLSIRESVANEIVEAFQEPETVKDQTQVTRKPIGWNIPQPLRESLGQQLFQAMRTTIGKEILSQSSRELIGAQLMNELRRPVSKEILSQQQPMTELTSKTPRKATEETVGQWPIESTCKEVIDQHISQRPKRDNGIAHRRTGEVDDQQTVQVPKKDMWDQQRFTQRIAGKLFNIDIDIDLPNRHTTALETKGKTQTPQLSQPPETLSAEDFTQLTPKTQILGETVFHPIPEERVDVSRKQRTYLRPTEDQPRDTDLSLNEYIPSIAETDAEKKPEVQARYIDELTPKAVAEVISPQVPQRPKRAIDKYIPKRPIRICDAVKPPTSVIPNVNIDINVDISPRLAEEVYIQGEELTSPVSIEQTIPKLPVQHFPPEISTSAPLVSQRSTQLPISAHPSMHPTSPPVDTQANYIPIGTLPLQPTQIQVTAPPFPTPTGMPIYSHHFQPNVQSHIRTTPVSPSTHLHIDKQPFQPASQTHFSASLIPHPTDLSIGIQPPSQMPASPLILPHPSQMPVYAPSFQPPTQAAQMPVSARTVLHPSEMPVSAPTIPSPTYPLQTPVNAPIIQSPPQIPVCAPTIQPPPQIPVCAPTILHPRQIPIKSSTISPSASKAISTPSFSPPTQISFSAPTLRYPSQIRRSSTSSSSEAPERRISVQQGYNMPVRVPTQSSSLGKQNVASTSLPPQIPSRTGSTSFQKIPMKDTKIEEMERRSEISKQYHYSYSPSQSMPDIPMEVVNMARIDSHDISHTPKVHHLSYEQLLDEQQASFIVESQDPGACPTGGFQTRTRPIKELSSTRGSDVGRMPIPKLRESVRQMESSVIKMMETTGSTSRNSEKHELSSCRSSEGSINSIFKGSVPVSFPDSTLAVPLSQEDQKLPIPKIRESFRNIRVSLSQMMDKCHTIERDYCGLDSDSKFSEPELCHRSQSKELSSKEKVRYSDSQVLYPQDMPQHPEFEPPQLHKKTSSLTSGPRLMRSIKCPSVRESFKEMRESIHSMLDEITVGKRSSRHVSTKTVSSNLDELQEVEEEAKTHGHHLPLESTRSESGVQKRKSFSIVTPSDKVYESGSTSSSESSDDSFRAKVARMRTNSPPSSDDLDTEMGETVSDWMPKSNALNDGFYVYRPLFRAPVHCIHGNEIDNEEYVEEFITVSDGAAASVSYIRDRTWLPYHRTSEMRFVIEDPIENKKDRRMTVRAANQRASVYGLDLNALKNLQKTKNKLPIRTESALDACFRHNYTVPTVNTIQKMRPIHDVQIEITAGTRDVKTETKAVEERLITYFLAKVASKDYR